MNELTEEQVDVKLDDLIDALKLSIGFSQVEFDEFEDVEASHLNVGKDTVEKHLQRLDQDVRPDVKFLNLSWLFLVVILRVFLNDLHKLSKMFFKWRVELVNNLNSSLDDGELVV